MGSFDEKEELRSLLKGINKDQFLEKLLEDASSASCDAIAANELPPGGVSKMVARSIKKAVDETQDLRFLCIRSEETTPLYDYFQALLGANVRSLQDIISRTTIEDLPPPKMRARLVQKKAKKMAAAEELYAFLKDINKEKYFWNFMDLGLNTPQEVRDCNSLGENPKIPKMVARVVQRHAEKVCKPNRPDYEITLTNEAKEQIRETWKMLSSCKRKSFGKAFYETMLALDSGAVPTFDGVSLSTIGMDFDLALESLVHELMADNPEKFRKRRDELVARLAKYKIPIHTLWLAVDAFDLAAVMVNPAIEVLQELESWRSFYRAIIPPLHPSLLKLIPFDRKSSPEQRPQNKLAESSFTIKLIDWFGRNGHVYFSNFLRDRKDFGHDIIKAFHSLQAWIDGMGEWTDFENQIKALLVDVKTDELKQLLIVETCRAVEEITVDQALFTCLEGVLTAGGIALFGTGVLQTFRQVQKDLVWDQWDQIYRHTAAECGECFYEFFTRDQKTKTMFARTNMKRQREVFVHQLNATLIRINEPNDSVLKPMLIQLGHVHRQRHFIESSVIISFEVPLKQAVSYMLGQTNWRRRAVDAWSYALRAIITRYMLVGWALGSDQKDAVIDWNYLRQFRDSNTTLYHIFFQCFAKSVAGLFHGESDFAKAAFRYMDAVNSIFDDSDSLAAVDRVEAIARRHKTYHAVSAAHFREGGKIWIGCATEVFGDKFDQKAKLQFARFWDLLTFSRLTALSLERAVNSVDLIPQGTPRKTGEIPGQEETVILTLQSKTLFAEDMAILRFKSSKPVPHLGGQFVKLRIKFEDRTLSRFYSVASASDPKTDTSMELEFLIKEVKGGKASPYLIHKITHGTEVEYLTTAGSFALPKPVDDCRRIMFSAGVGIVAFLSALRTVAKMAEAKMLIKKVHLSLVHTERTLELPVINELIEMSEKYHRDHAYFRFDLAFCFTGKSLDATRIDSLRSRCPSLYLERINVKIMSAALKEFSIPIETPMFACGPRVFQKLVRETFLKDLGHPRKLINLEFFDL